MNFKVNEIWKDIPNFEHKYEISNLGRVRNKNNDLFRQFQIQKRGKGYYCFNVYDEKEKKNLKLYVHRLVAELFIPNPENKCCVNHIDGNSLNNCVNNLEWVTHKENVLHSFKQKNKSYKSQIGARKLTKKDILEIREILSKRNPNDKYHKPSNTDIAKKYGVNPSVISNIYNGKAYLYI